MKLNCGCHAEYDSVFSAYVTDWHECPLHAAAPELLAALKAFVVDHDTDRTATAQDAGIAYSPCDCSLCEAARAAIARAEGER